MIMFYKNELLKQIKCKDDYKTKYGVVRRVSLGKIREKRFIGENIERMDVYIADDFIASSPYSYCDYVKALTDYGFIVDRRENFDTAEVDYNEYYSYIYAYIKL